MKVSFLIAFLLFLVGLRLFFFYTFPLILTSGQHVDFQTTLYQDPKVFGNTQEFFVRIGDFWHSTDVLVSAPSDTQISFGQTLRISGTAIKKVLHTKQVIFAIQNPQIEADNSGVLPFFGSIRAKIINFCENNFSQPYSSLLISIIFGIKNTVPAQVTTSFRITGLSHLLVVDGLKITLVAGFVMDLFLMLFPRKGAVAASALFILVYIALSGFEVSAVRAGIMAIAAFGAQLFGRQYTGIYLLAILGSAMLLWDPLLVENVAFQLSILATAGILVLTPVISGLKLLLPWHGILADDFDITLAAQIATLPILLTTFGTFSLISIPVHILVMWVIPVIMTVGGVGIGIGLVFAPVGKLIALCIIPLLWYLQGIAQLFANYFQPIQITNFPIACIIGYYLFLIAAVVYGQALMVKKSSIKS